MSSTRSKTRDPFLGIPWTPVINDLIGGWCVVAMAPGKVDGRSLGRLQDDFGETVGTIADFCDEKTARHIADLHNELLAG